jgi:hypothetical protein
MARAAVPLRAAAAMDKPMAKSAAIDRTIASTSAPGFFGASSPKAAMLTTMRMSSEVMARQKWTTSCAASTQAGGTGVVESRRRIPWSR